MKIDFIQVANIIFKDKYLYSNLTDKDKENNFFMINRKFAVGKYKQAQFFNDKYIDKESAMDVWNIFFKNQTGIPSWYWAPKNRIKLEKSGITKGDRQLLLDNTKLKNDDIDFMIDNYFDDLEYQIKKLKRFDK
jgi:hypothetical protein